jgi:hypothetical protein
MLPHTGSRFGTTDKPERYQDGIVIWQTPDDAKVPFLLRFNNTQIRYLNTTNSNTTFTDHWAMFARCTPATIITVNRSMFILGGYICGQARAL